MPLSQLALWLAIGAVSGAILGSSVIVLAERSGLGVTADGLPWLAPLTLLWVLVVVTTRLMKQGVPVANWLGLDGPPLRPTFWVGWLGLAGMLSIAVIIFVVVGNTIIVVAVTIVFIVRGIATVIVIIVAAVITTI